MKSYLKLNHGPNRHRSLTSIKVKVSPTQNAYFAGEPFTVAHSPIPAQTIHHPSHQYGKGKGKEVLEASRSALEKAKRSASVDISASEEYVQAYEVDSVTPRTTFPIPQNHPHARKRSIFDGHLQSNEAQLPLGTSTSTLDPIAETPAPLTHSYPPRKQPHQALGHGRPPIPIPHSNTTKPLPPNTTTHTPNSQEQHTSSHKLHQQPYPASVHISSKGPSWEGEAWILPVHAGPVRVLPVLQVPY
ncbi:hypothetical protein F4604DRAFT_1928279 [Suillus subluteus]|nr:hypothetical protein F4604DRAFT_1928279 [Suillus subluteus]